MLAQNANAYNRLFVTYGVEYIKIESFRRGVMKNGLFLTIVVYGLVFLFIGRSKMKRNGNYSQQKQEAGSARRSYHRERTTFNTTQTTSSPMKPRAQETTATRFPKPIHLNNSFGMGREKDDYITREKGKSSRGIFGEIGKKRDVDCDLDERIFGPRNQHKDIF